MATANSNPDQKPRTRRQRGGKKNNPSSKRPKRKTGKSGGRDKASKPASEAKRSGKRGGIHARIIKQLEAPDYRPMDKSELARALEVSPKERQSLRHAINDLESSGQVRRIKKGKIVLRGSDADKAKPKRGKKPSADRAGGSGGAADLVGILKFQPAGHAFVDPEVGRGKGVFIPRGATGTGLHGDKVSVKLAGGGGGDSPAWTKKVRNPQVRAKLEKKFAARGGGRGGDSSEGRVVEVVERRNNAVIATFRHRGKFHYAQPDDSMLPPTIELDAADLPDPPPEHGDKIVVGVERWESVKHHPRGRVRKVLGKAGTPGIDMLQIIYAHQLPLEFPAAVLKEAEAIPDRVKKKDREGREDWRDRPVFTIDPATAKDFDDAILVERRKKGGWKLAVHIADVAHYVKQGSKLDKEARSRGNSTYLADRVIPMLPHTLSDGLCSLVPGEDRLTHAAMMSFDAEGELKKVRFARAVIHSKRRFSYEEAYALMQKPDPSDPFSERLEVAWELASALRKRRFENGGLDLDMPEVRAVLNDDGKPVGMQRSEYDESHQLIEEFMLAANEAVAKQTKDKMKPCVYRVHEDPDADKLFEYRQLALSYGISAGDLSNRAEIQKVLDQAGGKPHEHAIKVGLLKSLKRAAYSEKPEGHYGLAKVNYTHFTSPIRRYADLVVHRVLAATCGTGPGKTPALAKLAETAEHLSTTERVSADAENESQKLKQLEFLWGEAQKGSDENPTTHPALVHEVRRKGLFIETTDYFIKGLVPERGLPFCRDGYWFDGTKMRFVGRNPNRTYQAGDTVQVAVEEVDFERKMVDFRIVDDAPAEKPGKRGGGSGSRSKGKRKDEGAETKPARAKEKTKPGGKPEEKPKRNRFNRRRRRR